MLRRFVNYREVALPLIDGTAKWIPSGTRWLASEGNDPDRQPALSRARKLEGTEKTEVYRVVRLPALADKIAAAIQYGFPRIIGRP